MPTATIEAARAWRKANIQERMPSISMRAPPDLRPLAEQWLRDRDPVVLEQLRDATLEADDAGLEVLLPEAVWDALVGDRLPPRAATAAAAGGR